MSYVPIHDPGQAITLKASAIITEGQIVAVSGSGTVAPAGADSNSWVGVASNNAAVNDSITIFAGGTQSVVASGAITAGDAVECADSGKVAVAAGVTPTTLVGVALTTAADGAQVRVRFLR